MIVQDDFSVLERVLPVVRLLCQFCQWFMYQALGLMHTFRASISGVILKTEAAIASKKFICINR